MNIKTRPSTLKRTALLGTAVVISGLSLLPSALASEATHQNGGAHPLSATTIEAVQQPQSPSCFERPITRPPGANGTPGNDVIIGTNGPDTIRGFAGNDRVCGRGGDDSLFGDRGDDRVHGNSGNDTVRGGPGTDRLFGGSGNDTLIGGPGFDRCDGGQGNADTAVTTGINRCEVVVNVP